MDLHGEPGKKLFSEAGPHVIPSTATTAHGSLVTADIDNVQHLTADNYSVTPRFDDANDDFLGYTITNRTTNKSVDIDKPSAPGLVTEPFEGVKFTFDFNNPSVEPAANDSWTILPTR